MQINRIKNFFKKYRRSLRLILSFLFAVYNGVIGLIGNSLWHMSIFVYIVLLLFVKAIVYWAVNKEEKQNLDINSGLSKRVFAITSILMFLISMALVAPIVIMVLNRRVVIFSLVVSIGIAAFTTYKVTLSAIFFAKNNKSQNILIKEITTISLIESIVSILTLQNTLIAVNGGDGNGGLFVLVAISSAVGLFAILFLIVHMIKSMAKITKATKTKQKC